MAYKVNTLDYSIGPCEMKDNYFKPVNATVPILGVPKFGMRKVSITEEVVADSAREAIEGLSFAHSLYLGLNEYDFGDGYFYYLVLDKVDAPKMHSPCILQQTFHFIGFRYEEKVNMTVDVNTDAKIDLSVGLPCDVKYTVTNESEKENSIGVLINGMSVLGVTGKVVIDGFKKTVENENGESIFSKSNIIDFPKLAQGSDSVRISATGKCKVEIMYYKIVI